jgi:predicted kinase
VAFFGHYPLSFDLRLARLALLEKIMKEQFEKFFAEFRNTKLWKDMEATTENSLWHRESSVARHVEMILEEYEKIAHLRSERQQALTWLCICFHDTGKPHAKKDKYTEERGHYTSFGGHEQISARIWENYAVDNWNRWKQLKKTFNLKESDIYVISWIIENHLPHNFSKESEMRRIATQMASPEFENGALADVFYDQLICDQKGRISDNHEKNIREVEEFIENIKSTPTSRLADHADDAPEMCIMIGTSGSGKSTYSATKKGYEKYSLDACRLEYAASNGVKGENDIDRYSCAFDYCGKHRGPFRQYADQRFQALIDRGVNMVIDNMNVNYKARENYIHAAKAAGYKITTVLFPITHEKLLERQKSRKDKTVPIDCVLDHYKRISMPWAGTECHSVEICTDNID